MSTYEEHMAILHPAWRRMCRANSTASKLREKLRYHLNGFRTPYKGRLLDRAGLRAELRIAVQELNEARADYYRIRDSWMDRNLTG